MAEQRQGLIAVNKSMNDIDQAIIAKCSFGRSSAAKTMRSQAHEVQERIARFRLTFAGSVLALAHKG